MIVVVDASVAVKWYVSEANVQEAQLLLQEDFDLHCPELALPEVGNIIWKKLRTNEVDSGQALRIIEAFADADIHFHPQKTPSQEALRGAIATGQSVYDWTYLALAIALDCPFVTADRRFYIAMRNTNFNKHLVWIEHIPSLI